MGFEVFDRTHDGFTYGQLRPPAQAANFGTVEKYKRIIANPATIASAVCTCGASAEPLTNPTGGIVDSAVFIGAQVVDLELRSRLLQRQQYRFYAIAYIEIGLPLLS